MAYKNVVQANLIAASNIDSFNRSFVADAIVENGCVFRSGVYSTTSEEGEVFTMVTPTTGNLDGLWMANEPEVVMTDAGNGKYYKGLNPDVRDFFIPSGGIFSGFKLTKGDIITLTGGAVLAGAYTSGTSTYVNSTDSARTLTWGTTSTASALSMKLLAETYISLTDGSSIGGSQRVTAYKFEVVNN